jgi:hypothetical protein
MSQHVGGVDAFMLLMQQAKDRMNRENLTPDQREARIRELASSGANLAMLLMNSGAALEATVETAEDREAEEQAAADGAMTLASLGDRFQEAVKKACTAEKGENERELNDALRALRSLITTDPKLVNRQGSFNVTALHIAMETASLEVVKTLLTFKAEETKPDTRLLNCFEQTPLMRLRKNGRTKPKAKECVELMLKYNREAGMVDASCPEDVDAILAAPKRESREPKDEDDASPFKKKIKKDEFESGDSRGMTLRFSLGPKEEKEVKDEPKEVKDEPKEVKDEPKEVKDEPKEVKDEPKELKDEPKD